MGLHLFQRRCSSDRRDLLLISIFFCLFTRTVQVDLKTCGDENSPVTCSFFFDKVDQAFRQKDVLYTLRKAFFPTEGARPFLFDVEVTLEIQSVPNISCSSQEYAFGDYPVSSPPSMSDVCDLLYDCERLVHSWKHQWSKTIVSYIIEREDLELLQDTNFVSFAAATFNSFDTSVFSDDDRGLEDDNSTNSSSVSVTRAATVQFLLNIDHLPCRPDDGVLLEAWEDILPWLQLYSSNSDNLENVEYTQSDRGFAFREGRLRNGGLTVPLLTIIHILLNIIFAMGATYLLHKYHHHLNNLRGKRYQMVASMYWSVVFVCLIGAIVIGVGNCYLYYALIFIDDQSLSVFGFRIVSDITVAALAVFELVASVLTPHDPKFFIPHLIRRTLCLNQCCHCCGSETRLNILRRAILGVAMWIIIVFLQLVIASILPLLVVIVLNPVPSLAFMSIMVSLFFCLIVFVAYFMNAFEGNYIIRHRLPLEQRRKSSISLSTLRRDFHMASNWTRNKVVLLVQAFVFLVIFVVMALVIILYLNFVRAGADTNSVGGLFVSLVPSAILGGITWAAKKHLFKELEDEIEAEEEKSDEKGSGKKLQSKGSVFEIGGISIHPKDFLRRSSRKKKRERLLNSVNSDECSPGVINKLAEVLDNAPEENVAHDSVINMEEQPDDTFVNVGLQEMEHDLENGEVSGKETDKEPEEQINQNEEDASNQ